MKHIFVATDGSDPAMKAVELAAHMAAKFGVPLTVGHVLNFSRTGRELARMAEVEHITERVNTQTDVDFNLMMRSGGDLFADTRPSSDVVRAITLVGDEILQRAADHAKELGATQVQTRSDQGDTADAILDMAEAVGADHIVVGHRGLGRLKTLALGSVAHKVSQHAPCTVTTVR